MTTSKDVDGTEPSLTVKLSKAEWLKILGVFMTGCISLGGLGWSWASRLSHEVNDHTYRLQALEQFKSETRSDMKELLVEMKAMRTALDILTGRTFPGNPR
jgi:hypothetical protein